MTLESELKVSKFDFSPLPAAISQHDDLDTRCVLTENFC